MNMNRHIWKLGIAACCIAQIANAAGHMVVANRGGASLSVIDVESDQVVRTISLPGSEPMYVSYSPAQNRFFVGDRANSRLVVFNARTFEQEAEAPTCRGVWHMWADQSERQLWVVCDIDNAASVIDPITLETIRTLPMPADLTGGGWKPHDVVLDPNGAFAFITMTKAAAPSYVVKFDTRTFAEIARRAVGIDAHLGSARGSKSIYVPAQGSNAVHVLNEDTLADVVAPIFVPAAHGAGMSRDGQTFFTTNITGGGVNGLVAIDTNTNTVIGHVDTTPSGLIMTPHNIALTPNGRKLYVTHSGPANDKVTVYESVGNSRIPTYTITVPVGLNPFGLAYIP